MKQIPTNHRRKAVSLSTTLKTRNKDSRNTKQIPTNHHPKAISLLTTLKTRNKDSPNMKRIPTNHVAKPFLFQLHSKPEL